MCLTGTRFATWGMTSEKGLSKETEQIMFPRIISRVPELSTALPRYPSPNRLPFGFPTRSSWLGAWPFSQAPNSDSCITLGSSFWLNQTTSTNASPAQSYRTQGLGWSLDTLSAAPPYQSPGQSGLQGLRANSYNYTPLEFRHMLLPTAICTLLLLPCIHLLTQKPLW